MLIDENNSIEKEKEKGIKKANRRSKRGKR